MVRPTKKQHEKVLELYAKDNPTEKWIKKEMKKVKKSKEAKLLRSVEI